MDPYPFPPPGVVGLDSNNERYHQAIKAHSDKLIAQAKDSKINYSLALKSIDPATNSISFLAILIFAADHPKDVPPPELAEYIIRFLVSFDPRQIRYGGPAFMNLCLHILSLALVPSSIAIESVAIALQKLDPSGSVLTPAHLALVELAVQTKEAKSPALFDVINQKILFYPGMHNQVPKGTIAADMSLPAPHFMHGNSGLINNLKVGEVIRYDLACGTLHALRRDWRATYECWLRCATHPSKDGGVSQIMVHAYKRLALVSLLLGGRAVQLPPNHTSGSAARVYDIMGRPYAIFAALFETTNAPELIKHATDCQKLWAHDQTTGLVAECLSAYQKWKIIDLRDIYTKVFLSQVQSQTRSGQTGHESETVDEVEALVKEMLTEGMLRGQLGTTAQGKKYLEFLPEKPVLSEEEYHHQLLASMRRLKEVEPLWRIADDRVSTSKEHIKHIVRMETGNKKRGGGGAGGGGMGGPGANTSFSSGGFMDPGFEDPMEDEDLMGDSF